MKKISILIGIIILIIGVILLTTSKSSSAISLTITSNPPTSSISINGKPTGETPLELKLDPGSYTVSASKTNYATVTKTLELAKNDSIFFQLPPSNTQTKISTSKLINPSVTESNIIGIDPATSLPIDANTNTPLHNNQVTYINTNNRFATSLHRDEGTIYLSDLNANTTQQYPNLGQGSIDAAATNNTGSLIAYLSNYDIPSKSYTLSIYDRLSAKTTTFTNIQANAVSLLTPNNLLGIRTYSDNSTIDLFILNYTNRTFPYRNTVSDYAISPNHQFVSILSQSKDTIIVYDAQTERSKTFQGRQIDQIAWINNAEILTINSNDNEIYVIDINSNIPSIINNISLPDIKQIIGYQQGSLIILTQDDTIVSMPLGI